MRLHLGSALIGAGLAVLAAVAMGLKTVTSQQSVLGASVSPVVRYTDYVYITNAESGAEDYVVPVGKVLIITGVMNRSATGTAAQVRVGPTGSTIQVAWARVGSSSGEQTTQSFRLGSVHGYPVGGGEGVRIIAGGTPNTVWVVGYLVDA